MSAEVWFLYEWHGEGLAHISSGSGWDGNPLCGAPRSQENISWTSSPAPPSMPLCAACFARALVPESLSLKREA